MPSLASSCWDGSCSIVSVDSSLFFPDNQGIFKVRKTTVASFGYVWLANNFLTTIPCL